MVISKELYDHFDTLGKALLTPNGKEINDDRPIFVPGHVRPLSITEQIQRLMRVELSRQAMEQGEETFQEADDLEPDDDPDDLSRYQQMEPDPGIVALGRKESLDGDEDNANPEAIDEEEPQEGIHENPPAAPVKPGKKVKK